MIEEKQNLKVIENRLMSALHPVKIRPAFVDDLRQRLEEEMIERRKKEKVKKALLVTGSVVGGLVMVVAIIRSLTSWREIVKIVEEWVLRQKRGQQTISA